MAVRARVADDYGSRFSSFVSAKAAPSLCHGKTLSIPHPSRREEKDRMVRETACGLEAGIEEKSEEKWEWRKREPIQLADDFNARRADVGGPAASNNPSELLSPSARVLSLPYESHSSFLAMKIGYRVIFFNGDFSRWLAFEPFLSRDIRVINRCFSRKKLRAITLTIRQLKYSS